MQGPTGKFDAILGIVVVAGLATGFAGLIVALFAIFTGDWTGAGLGLVAAALAFGLLANAILRD